MSEHTPGRISLAFVDENDCYLQGEDGFYVAECKTIRDIDEDKANTLRLASCWNACEGIENPAAIPELVEAAIGFSAWFDANFHSVLRRLEDDPSLATWLRSIRDRNHHALAALRGETK